VTATYRLQMHAGFQFADAEAQVPYFAALGVTHLYLSPILQAAPGSRHGYDVVDHATISRDLGGEQALLSLSATARHHGLGLVVDVVPNHMAFATPEHLNRPLWAVLAEGQGASTAHWFDIDWEAGNGKLGLPILGSPLQEVLEAGEITLGEYDGLPVLRYYDHVLPVALGSDSGDVAEVLDRQHYRLAGWRERDSVLNYRRFFDIDALIAVRVEEADVFEATHRLLLDLNRLGVIEGFRIDHPDGLADPEGYFMRLRQQTMAGTAVWAEKIVEGTEQLPPSWACEGATGYDGLKAVTAALVDPTTAPVLNEAWATSGGELDLHHVEQQAKRQVVTELLGPEHRRLSRRASDALPQADPARLAEAIAELLVSGDVYRAYLNPGQPLTPAARSVVDGTLRTAVEARPDLLAELEQVAKLMRGEGTGDAAADFAVRFQQTWGPVMAKGIEDTTFYRWHRLVALNEVGGDPTLLENAAPELLHAWAEHQQAEWPLGMSTLSTHDTKRSEDVRARIIAVAGDGDTWSRCSQEFAEAADDHGVDRPTAHMLWQTLVGVGDIDADRLDAYLNKALREAKQHTSWSDPDTDYEARVRKLADEATSSGPLRSLLLTAVDHNSDAIRAAILGQKLLQLTLPGVPDTYQGCELVDLSLVDPDNRRAVDYGIRAQRLRELVDNVPADLDDEKLLVTSRALVFRRDHRTLFGDSSSYQPLEQRTRHAVGFVRGGNVAVLVTRAHLRLAAAGGWADEVVALPEGIWRDELTLAMHYGGKLRCADLFDRLPVTLLHRLEV
jgi:(1->4)-alpha-D-glucan 1-alpha-D-glucosylmutase